MLTGGTMLVPLDGSSTAERSVPYASALARKFDAHLVLLTAAYISEIPGHAVFSDEMLANPTALCLEYLSAAKDRLDVKDARLAAKVGYPQETILETAREENASLIVLSSHGRSGINRWMYGSTAGHVLHSSTIPLLVVGKNVPDDLGSAYAPKHVMVPLEGTPLGECSLPYAVEIARAFSSRITLARAVPPAVEAYPLMVPQVYFADLDKELVASAQAYLERISSSVEAPSNIAVLKGPRADALLTYEEQNGVDLVVMATHGRAGVQRALLGSTADRMLNGPAPVLLIRPN